MFTPTFVMVQTELLIVILIIPLYKFCGFCMIIKLLKLSRVYTVSWFPGLPFFLVNVSEIKLTYEIVDSKNNNTLNE